MSERPKVQHSKCCVVSQPPWVQIPALPPLTARPRWGRAVLLCCPRMPGASREQKRTRGACVKPGPPLCGLLWACVKPGPPLPVSWRLIWGVLVKRGWSGFQRGRGYETGSARAWVVVGVCETWAARACSMGPEMGSFGEAGVVWVSRGRVCETWASPVWVVVGVCETWAARACSMAPDMGSFGEAGVVWVSAGVWV